jgi:PmbA protein
MDINFAKELIDSALQDGVDQAEVYIKISRTLGIDVKEQKIETIDKSITSGYSLRIIKDNRLGFSYSTDAKEAESVVKRAIEASRHAEPDYYLDLPIPIETMNKPLIFDESIVSLSEDAAIDLTFLIESTALKEDSRIKKVRKASGSFSINDVYLLNSKGINHHYKSTSCSAHIMLIAENGYESQMGWDYQASRFLGDLSFEEVGKVAAKRALTLLGAKNISPTKGYVLLDNSVAAEFLGIFSSLLSAESVQKKKSLLQGKIGQKILSERFNIIDSGLIDKKIGSRPIDDEGVPTSNKILIERGILKGFIHNTYTAKKDNTQSTGNAIRGGYAGLPSVGPTNLFVEALSEEKIYPLTGLIEAIDKGVYVLEAMGMHTANPISGEFSIGISGLWIEKGKIIHPIKEAMISGNILDLFKNIVMIGDDLRFYGNIGTPSLLIEDMDISG